MGTMKSDAQQRHSVQTRPIGWVLGLCTFLLAGCGTSTTASTGNAAQYSCDQASIGRCTLYGAPTALNSAQLMILQNNCATSQPPSTLANGDTCPTANRVGFCTLTTTGATTSATLNYYSPVNTANSAAALCADLGGNWTATP